MMRKPEQLVWGWGKHEGLGALRQALLAQPPGTGPLPGPVEKGDKSVR